eukprot:PhM_4_TR2196/c0_g1_i1/m.41682
MNSRCAILEFPEDQWHIIHSLADDSHVCVTHIDPFSGQLIHNPRQATFPSVGVAIDVLTAGKAPTSLIPCLAVAGYVSTGLSANILIIQAAHVRATLPPAHDIYVVDESKWVEVPLHDPLVYFTQWYSSSFKYRSGVFVVMSNTSLTGSASLESIDNNSNIRENAIGGAVMERNPCMATPMPGRGDISIDGEVGAGEPGEYHVRLRRFFEHYDHAMVERIDDVLRAFAGREDMLMSLLVQRHGPEPSPACEVVDPLSDVEKETRRRWRRRLTAFYRHYCPEKLSSVDSLLTSAKGKEDELMQKLVAKYGKEPEATEGFGVTRRAETSARRLRRTNVNDHYYFCLSLELTQHFPPSGEEPPDTNYGWNSEMLADFRSAGVVSCCVTLTRGYYATHVVSSLPSGDVSMTLAIRQCHLNPGTRLIARGLARCGLPGVGNEYECELVIFAKGSTELPPDLMSYGGTTAPSPSTGSTTPRSGTAHPTQQKGTSASDDGAPDKYVYSTFRWTRGTVPLRWSSKLRAQDVSPTVEMDPVNPYRGVTAYWRRVWEKHSSDKFLCVNLLKNNLEKCHAWNVEAEVPPDVFALLEAAGIQDATGDINDECEAESLASSSDEDGELSPRSSPMPISASSPGVLGMSPQFDALSSSPQLGQSPSTTGIPGLSSTTSNSMAKPSEACHGEPLLGLCYERSLRGLGRADFPTRLCHIDWHTLTSRVGVESAAKVLWEYVVEHMEAGGSSSGVLHDAGGNVVEHVQHSKQSTYIRVNCADSLDRTNLVCFLSVLQVVPQMLLHMHCLHRGHEGVALPLKFPMRSDSYAETIAQYPRRFISVLAALFSCGGDACAMLFCNSPAMHGGVLRSLADPKLVTKSLGHNNAWISLKRRYNSNVLDAHRTYKLILLLGRHWGHLFPRRRGRFLTKPEAQRAVVVLDSPDLQQALSDELFRCMSSEDISLVADAGGLGEDTTIAEYVVSILSSVDDVDEVFVNTYPSPISHKYTRPLCMVVFKTKRMDWDYQVHKIESLHYVSALAPKLACVGLDGSFGTLSNASIASRHHHNDGGEGGGVGGHLRHAGAKGKELLDAHTEKVRNKVVGTLGKIKTKLSLPSIGKMGGRRSSRVEPTPAVVEDGRSGQQHQHPPESPTKIDT